MLMSHPAEDNSAAHTAPDPGLRLRRAGLPDLEAINALISRAVMTWSLPERVKRLAMPTYLYGAHELDHLDMTLAEDDAGHPVGVAAWEPADLRDCPAGQRGLLLHGLYVDPVHQSHGVGSRLLDAAAEQGRSGGYDGILVKAQADAEGFFQRRGLRSIPVLDPGRDYPNRCWLDLIPLD